MDYTKYGQLFWQAWVELCQSLQSSWYVFLLKLSIFHLDLLSRFYYHKRNWIEEFCLKNLVWYDFCLNDPKKDCFINSIPWSVSKMLLRRATLVDFFLDTLVNAILHCYFQFTFLKNVFFILFPRFCKPQFCPKTFCKHFLEIQLKLPGVLRHIFFKNQRKFPRKSLW